MRERGFLPGVQVSKIGILFHILTKRTSTYSYLLATTRIECPPVQLSNRVCRVDRTVEAAAGVAKTFHIEASMGPRREYFSFDE